MTKRANLGLFVREGEREIRLDGLIGDDNSKTSVGRSREAAAAEIVAAKAIEAIVVATAEASAAMAAVELTRMRD